MVKSWQNARRSQRRTVQSSVTMAWQDSGGRSRCFHTSTVDMSESGLRVLTPEPIPCGSTVYLEGEKLAVSGNAVVRHCEPQDRGYSVGVEFDRKSDGRFPSPELVDYYEILQISPNAEPDTIHRVFRIMAARFHPDNPQTGNSEKFLLLSKAYEVLSDPARRAEYDAVHRDRQHKTLPVFELRDFVDEVDGEFNRRLGILCLLYQRRRSNTDRPSIALLELEELMSIPREYLAFTIWYLKEKRSISMDDSSNYCLTAEGADYVESKMQSSGIVSRLLTAPRAASVAAAPAQAAS